MVRAMPEMIRGRYAPSPTGDLHLGNLRTALLAWLFSRSLGGQFVLRVEDLDRPRIRPGATEHMLSDLSWLGLDWDEGPDVGGPYEPYTQSERLALYEHYLQRLRDLDLIYPCYCSRAEIARAAGMTERAPGQSPDRAPARDAPTFPTDDQLQQGDEGMRYPGTCRHLTAAQRRQHEANNHRPSLRFRVNDERLVSFIDLLVGPTQQQVQQAVGDFIVRRSDGIFAYQFAVVVDDALMHINQVLRGADLLHSTARQILLYEALGFPIPTFAHVPLLLDDQGKRLAKRIQSAGLEPLRAAGITPPQVVGQLAASCGLVDKGEAISATELVWRYDRQTYDIMRTKIQG